LCALARSRGALAIVDGAQAVGQIQVDVQALGCDAYVGSPHKWIRAPKGTGFLYLRRGAGPFLDDAGELPVGQPRGRRLPLRSSVPVVDGLMAALRFIETVGMPRIERWDANLTRQRDGLAARIVSPAATNIPPRRVRLTTLS
jgi:selenocysteine lyase/cysteine desulfurase